ncbi:hypothetical protein [Bernardetia sp.]|uniref:hypothetical protein n=1 Tax=Bernardetia sp. TaxID=1937974 RepID=UPI0025BB9593|nr:hypothetical protein [Bernardetia sp.]
MSNQNKYDTFELKWSIYEYRRRKEDNTKKYFHFIRHKEATESFTDFFSLLQGGKKYITSNYIINGVDFVQYVKIIVSSTIILEAPNHSFNTLTFNFNASARRSTAEDYMSELYLPSLYITLKQILGKKIAYEDIVYWLPDSLEMDKESLDNLRQEHYEEESKDMQLYCCSQCGDRECGYYPLEISRDDTSIKWRFHEYHRPFVFKSDEYEKSFTDFKEFVKTLSKDKYFQNLLDSL